MEVTLETLSALSEAIERTEAALREETMTFHRQRHEAGPMLCAHLDRALRMRVRRYDTLCRLWLTLRAELEADALVEGTREFLDETETAVRIRLVTNEQPTLDGLPF